MTGRRGWTGDPPRPPVPPLAAINRAKTHCGTCGDPLAGGNLYLHTTPADGQQRRHCRRCRAEQSRQRRRIAGRAPRTRPHDSGVG